MCNRNVSGEKTLLSQIPELTTASRGTSLSLCHVKTAALCSKAFLLEALGFRFCRAGASEAASRRGLPPSPPRQHCSPETLRVGVAVAVGTKQALMKRSRE